MKRYFILCLFLISIVSLAEDSQQEKRNWSEAYERISMGVTAAAIGQKSEQYDRLECFKKIKSAYLEIKKKEIKPVGMSAPSREPSDFVISDSGEVAWLNGQGKMVVSSEKGSVVVEGRACTSDKDLSVKTAFQLAYDYMGSFDKKHWAEAQKYCSAAGFKTTAEYMTSSSPQQKSKSEADGVH